MANNHNRYDYDHEKYYYDEDEDLIHSYSGGDDESETYRGDGSRVDYDD